jgi:alanine racemase
MTAPSETARAWVDVDLDALVANARILAAACDTRLLPMVKANGYGLGAVPVARALESLDPWGYGVATVEEGLALRAAGLRRPVLVVSPLTPDLLEPMLAAGFRPAIGDVAMLRAWLARSSAPFHLEVDSGMSRGGFRWTDRAAIAGAAQLLPAAAGWEGIFTHFHSADTDDRTKAAQWKRFQNVLAALPRRPPLVHAANSAAALCGSAYAADMIRPGIFLYGGEAWPGGPLPRPVAALRARVVAVRGLEAGASVSYGGTWSTDRPTTIATLGIGYADGMPRATDRAPSWPPREVELGGRLLPIVGRVTMDMCMVAVDDRRVAAGDVATIFGGLVTLDRCARSVGTISYELLTSLGARLPRRYG